MNANPRALVTVVCLAAALACSGSTGGGNAGASSTSRRPAAPRTVARVQAETSALVLLLILEAAELEARRNAEVKARTPDVIYVPTPEPIVDKMLELAEVGEGDVVYDLGCGDGRIVVTAAKRYGVKAWGFDIDPVRVEEARENAKAAGVEHLVTIEEQDIFTLDLSPASVVTLYLLPELNVRLIPQLEKLKPGSRIVSHDFDMKGVTPLEHLTLPFRGTSHQIYLWETPLQP